MKIYYLNGFYFDDAKIPTGAVEISEKKYRLLLEGQANGQQIIANAQGEPILIAPAPSPYHQLKNNEWVISKKDQQALFEKQQKILFQTLSDKTDSLKSLILAGYPQSEIDSFYVQEREAREWQADNNAPTPMLSAIAENRGVPLDILIEKVLEKANQLAGVMGAILGQKQAFEDRINAAKTLENLTALLEEIEQWQLPQLN